MLIKITHQEDKTEFKFRVKRADKLTHAEVIRICNKMRVKALFVNGKYYTL
jgi:hypothetical protein